MKYMSQKELIKDYLNSNEFITPAQMSGKFWKGHIFGSEVSRRCRDLREEGFLMSIQDGKFEKFFLKTAINTAQRVAEWNKQFYPINYAEKGLQGLF